MKFKKNTYIKFFTRYILCEPKILKNYIGIIFDGKNIHDNNNDVEYLNQIIKYFEEKNYMFYGNLAIPQNTIAKIIDIIDDNLILKIDEKVNVIIANWTLSGDKNYNTKEYKAVFSRKYSD
jgi:hypothetical protein